MPGSTISSKINISVTLGTAGYTSPLTITSTGQIDGSAQAALYVPAMAMPGVVRNAGTIIGTHGQAGGDPGGVEVSGIARIFNSGSIVGGTGNQGGYGVELRAAGAMLINTGVIAGGHYFGGGYGSAGTGVVLYAGTKLNNSGTIAGGAGQRYDGSGVIDMSGTLVNSGTIRAGDSPSNYGSGVSIAGMGAKGSNTGLIIGSGAIQYYSPEVRQPACGVYAKDGAVFTNSGTIAGGSEGRGAEVINATLINRGLIEGGANAGTPFSSYYQIYTTGVVFESGSLENTGTILGGSAAGASNKIGVNGGTGLIASAGFTNRGLIAGGAGGNGLGNGGYGVQIAGSVTNFGTIAGGQGANGYSGFTYYGGRGGIAVQMSGGTTFLNHGLVNGGASGAGGFYTPGNPPVAASFGGTGVVATGSGNTIVNKGTILGGAETAGGGYGGGGGGGVEITDSTLINSGLVSGGAGYAARGYVGYGGDGVSLFTGAVLQNSGTIRGGAGEYGGGVFDSSGTLINSGSIIGGAGLDNKPGGYGVFITGALAKGRNSGEIVGGTGQQASLNSSGNVYSGLGLYAVDDAVFTNNGTISGGSLGIGARIANATLINHGLIQGGKGGDAAYFSNDYVNLTGVAFTGGELVNTGTILGGNSAHSMPEDQDKGGTGVYATASFTNRGMIAGGKGGNYDGNGGIGVEIARQGITNFGTIAGGRGANYGFYQYFGGNGGFGVGMAVNTSFTNNGVVIGGTGGTGSHYLDGAGYGPSHPGGVGVRTAGADTLVNNGTILGGHGGRGEGFGGDGGAGVVLSGSLDNSGSIIGGAGAYGQYSFGNGGVGVDIVAGAMVLNSGTILGGRGESGGIGLVDDGGVLINAGLISGGFGDGGKGKPGDAVSLASNATLVVESGASFDGLVAATSSGGDTLELAGTSSTPLAGIGTSFTGFATIAFADNAAWTISGTSIGLASGQDITGFTKTDAIVLTDAAAASGTVNVANAGTITLDAGGTIYNLDIAGATVGETNFIFADYTLTQTGSPEMTFLAPTATDIAGAEDPAARFASFTKFEDLIPRPGSKATYTLASATAPGAIQDLLRLHQHLVSPAVTLHA